MSNRVKIIVMRHGESENNIIDVLSSNTGNVFKLTSKGREQVKEKGAILAKSEKIDLILTSPLVRTKETAKIIAECAKLPGVAIHVDDRLREPYFGKVEGKTYKEYLSLTSKQKGLFDLGVVKGESGASIFQRVSQLLDGIASSQEYRGTTILLVSHSFTICQILKYFGKEQTKLPGQAAYFMFEI